MTGRRLVPWAGLILFLYSILGGGQLSLTWAQAQPEGAIESTVYVDRALVAYEDKKFEEALKELQEALRLNPENLDALYYQGLVYVALGRTGDALVYRLTNSFTIT